MSSPHPATLRSLYRRLLRELPSRTPVLAPRTRASHFVLSNPSPLQRHIRSTLSADHHTSGAPTVDEAEQFVQYVRAQRMYITLVERYNPGTNMDGEELVRLTARRVGMNLPVDFDPEKN